MNGDTGDVCNSACPRKAVRIRERGDHTQRVDQRSIRPEELDHSGCPDVFSEERLESYLR